MEEFEQGSSPDLSGGTTQEGSEPNLSPSPEGEQPSVFDLDSAEKVKWQGREYSRDELSKQFMMHSDYTKKTQALSEERKYAENFPYDVLNVLKNPSMAARFKQVYPQAYHAHVDAALKTYQQLRSQGVGHQQAAEQAQDQQKQGIPQEFMDRFERLENQIKETNVAKIEAQLDAKFSKLSKDYPFADEEMVLARAEALLDQGTKLTDEVWDKLWKSSHDRLSRLSDERYSKQVNQQKQANLKGRDIASGGGIPGRAPKTPKTIREATDLFLEENA